MLRENNLGYTFLEMLLVLVVTMVILKMLFLRVNVFWMKNELKKEAEKLGSIVQNYQISAVLEQKEIKISLHENGIVISTRDEILEEVKMNNKITIASNFPDNEIKINSSGNIQKAGTVVYKCGDSDTKIIFSIGRGRYRIE